MKKMPAALHICAFAVLFSALLLSLTGCGRAEEEALTELWVVTEASKSDGMNLQAELVAESFEKAHPGITVELEILPTDAQARETYLHQLRTQIMAGEGPDVYLLPTGGTLSTGTPKSLKEIQVEPLFPDVRQSMCSGIFRDIREYYDGDAALNTAALHPDIMDAGCLREERYVLPLRFDTTVLMADGANWAASGLDASLLNGGLDTLTEAILESDVTQMAAYGLQLPDDLTALPQVFDYEKGELLVNQQQIADYMRLYQRWKAESVRQAQPVNEKWEQYVEDSVEPSFLKFLGFSEVDHTCFNRINYYFNYKLHWISAGFPVFTESTEYIMDAALMANRLGQDAALYPLRDIDGLSHARITYYGAVGSGCSQPELAYDFLRQFLTEEYQWDLYRPRVEKTSEPFDYEQDDPQCYILVESSWPVRVFGAVEHLWDNRDYQLFHYSGTQARILALHADGILTEEDLSVLSGPLDAVDFPIVQAEEETLSHALSQLNDEKGQPADADIDKLAQQVYENLWWHLAEG